jgi:hypothetical protein
MVLAIKFVYNYYFLLQAAKKSESLFQLIDVDKDGTLSEQEFLRVMSSSYLKFLFGLLTIILTGLPAGWRADGKTEQNCGGE